MPQLSFWSRGTSEREARLQGWRVNINAIFSTLFISSQKVGQDKLGARSDAEQHPQLSYVCFMHTHSSCFSISFRRTAVPRTETGLVPLKWMFIEAHLNVPWPVWLYVFIYFFWDFLLVIYWMLINIWDYSLGNTKNKQHCELSSWIFECFLLISHWRLSVKLA